jgi:hypothetical protein
MTPSESKAKVLQFTRRPFAAVAAVEDADGKGARLLEPGTGKELHVLWDELEGAEERSSPLRPSPYLILLFSDGRQIALAEVGFAFAPATVNTGPLPDLPATFCFADFRHLAQGVESLLEAEGREKEALGAILMSIALLDGARAAGLPVAKEERCLDGLLRRLEERGVKV